MRVLGIDVDEARVDAWRQWLAPAVQPFFVPTLRPWPKTEPAELTDELRHTFRVWNVDRRLCTLWLDEAAFLALDRSERTALVRSQLAHGRGAVPTVRRWADVIDGDAARAQADGHRFVWWPSLVATNPAAILARAITTAPDGTAPQALPSRHPQVATTTWHRAAAVLPRARALGGSFPASSRPNCFSTVLAAAGATDADAFATEAPFLAWLDGWQARTGGGDDEPGTVLVWREPGGRPVHAAVTIGDGWALEKASGEWWTPRAVRRVDEVIRATRTRGLRLTRYP